MLGAFLVELRSKETHEPREYNGLQKMHGPRIEVMTIRDIAGATSTLLVRD